MDYAAVENDKPDQRSSNVAAADGPSEDTVVVVFLFVCFFIYQP